MRCRSITASRSAFRAASSSAVSQFIPRLLKLACRHGSGAASRPTSHVRQASTSRANMTSTTASRACRTSGDASSGSEICCTSGTHRHGRARPDPPPASSM